MEGRRLCLEEIHAGLSEGTDARDNAAPALNIHSGSQGALLPP